jgi:hypothetical protein
MAHKQQTSVQDSTTVKWGSCLMEVGATVGALVNVGALRDVVWEETFDKVNVPTDNAGDLERGIRNHRCAISGIWMEINWDNLAKVYAGVHAVTPADTTPVAITDEEHTLNDRDFERFDFKNGAGTEVASISVDNLAAATLTYIRDCDYILTVDPQGWTGIAAAYPTIIEEDSALIAVENTSEYVLSAGAYDVLPAVGDHIYVTGFTESANNGVKTVTAAEAAKITVSDTLVNEVEGDTINIVRGANLDADATVFINYTYTPLASRTYVGGGLTEFTPQIVRITNYNADNETLQCTIWEATPDSGIKIEFQSDDAEDPAGVPIRMEGRLDVTKTAGEQLFEIVDTQQTA